MFRANEYVLKDWDIEFFAKRVCDFGCLIKTTLSKTFSAEGDGNNNNIFVGNYFWVGIEFFNVESELFPQKYTSAFEATKLKSVNQLFCERIFVLEKTPKKIGGVLVADFLGER